VLTTLGAQKDLSIFYNYWTGKEMEKGFAWDRPNLGTIVSTEDPRKQFVVFAPINQAFQAYVHLYLYTYI